VLELARAGAGGRPVLREGAVVAVLRTSTWRESASAVVGDREWVLDRRRGGVLVGRWAADPEDAVRHRAEQTSTWRDRWRIDLQGTAVDASTVSWWSGRLRFSVHGRTVAESGSTGGWSDRRTLTAGDDLPLDAQVFLLWVQYVADRRASS
jgi:hypothetical protein